MDWNSRRKMETLVKPYFGNFYQMSVLENIPLTSLIKEISFLIVTFTSVI